MCIMVHDLLAWYLSSSAVLSQIIGVLGGIGSSSGKRCIV